MSAPAPTASCVVIGNEILSGKVRDSNAHFLARWLRTRGVDLWRIQVIPDVIPVIQQVVREESQRSTHVFTSGGIGPTHDDMTYAGVAAAFGLPTQAHPVVLAHMEKFYGGDPGPVRRRMAEMPHPCVLHQNPPWWVPVVQVHNVFILPGVPMLFEPLLEGLSSVVGGGVPVTLHSIYTRQGEEDLAPHLEATLQHHPGLEIGSYPRLDRDADHKVRITLESRDAAQCANATRWLLARLDASALVRVEGL